MPFKIVGSAAQLLDKLLNTLSLRQSKPNTNAEQTLTRLVITIRITTVVIALLLVIISTISGSNKRHQKSQHTSSCSLAGTGNESPEKKQ